MSFLTKKAGPLPVWGWGAVAAGGAFMLFRKSAAPKTNGSDASSGGQSIPNYNFKTTLSQNNGWDTVPYSPHPYGSMVSEIDGSFFGDGPLSLWTGGPMEYTDVFRDHQGRDRGVGRYRGRDREGYGPHSGGRDHFNPPPGGGGFGYHHWKGPGFPPPPSGGEGYDNGGDHFYGGTGGGPARTGGNPWNQQVTQGTQGGQYHVQRGDTYQSVADKLWGPGSDFSGLQSANGGQRVGRNGQLSAGITLTVPGAPSSGPPAPGGPAGNGIGGGSINGNGVNPGSTPALIGGYGPGQTQPGAGTSSAGAGGGGSPTLGQSGGNSSRVKRGNASRSYAQSGGGR